MSNSFTLEDYLRADATTLAHKVRTGQVTSVRLVELAFEQIEQTRPDLNNIVSLCKDEALRAAQQLKDEGQPFLGVPILLKGLGHTYPGADESKGLGFLAQSLATVESQQAYWLKQAGFIVIGQTTYPQLGWLNVTKSDLFGATANPWHLDHNAGGSSGGAAAAVASGQVPLASSSDGGGSTRIPAAWSGLIGLHPSRGILRWDTSEAQQTVSHFAEARTMRDTVNLFEYMVKDEMKDRLGQGGLDRRTPLAYTLETPAGTPLSNEAKQAVMAAVAFLEAQGYCLEEVAYPVDGERLMMQYYVLAAYSAYELRTKVKTALGREFEMEDGELITWGLYQAGASLTMADVTQAWQILDQARETMQAFYQRYSVLLTATNAFPAPERTYSYIEADKIGLMQDMSRLNKQERIQFIYDQWLPAWVLTPYTQLANLTGMPALSLPTHLTAEGLPMGVMLSAAYLQDRLLLELGQLFERQHGFVTLPFLSNR